MTKSMLTAQAGNTLQWLATVLVGSSLVLVISAIFVNLVPADSTTWQRPVPVSQGQQHGGDRPIALRHWQQA